VVRRWQLINGEKMHRSCTSELERGGDRGVQFWLGVLRVYIGVVEWWTVKGAVKPPLKIVKAVISWE
jgi:hypothetical protein